MVVHDKEKLDLAEADFHSEYPGVDIYDLWKRGSGLSYRKAATLLYHLPPKSRLRQSLPKDHVLWTQEDHHRQDMIDLLQQILYYTITDATVKDGLKRSDIQKIHRQAPKRTRRPGEVVEKPKFLSGKQFRRLLNSDPDWEGMKGE